MLQKQLAILSTAAFILGTQFCDAGKTSQPYNDNPPYNFHDETDKTDIFAIQLDSSEEEQNEELETLEAGYPPHEGKSK